MMGLDVHLKSWKCSVIIIVMSLYFFNDELFANNNVIFFYWKKFLFSLHLHSYVE